MRKIAQGKYTRKITRGKPAALCQKVVKGSRFIFQHDTDPKYTVAEGEKGECPWVGYSEPDLNPTENMWNDSKTSVY